MIKKITYVATDGTEFTKESECQAYEDVINNLFVGFTFFDSDRNIVDKNQSISNLLYEAKYFYVDNNLNIEKLIFNLNRIQEYNPIFETFKQIPTRLLYGLWFYDNDEWQNFNVIKIYYNDLEKEFRIKITNN